MTRTRFGTRGLWLAQVFVALTLGFLAFRMALRTPAGSGDMNSRAPAPTSTARAPASARPTERSPRPGPAGRQPARPPDPLPTNASREPARSNPAKSPYAADQYRSALLRDLESYQSWALDSRELAWLLANQRQVLTSDLETRPESAGGLRVFGVRADSFPSRRGLRVGDVLKDINGQALDDAFDLDDLIGDPAYSGSKGWRVTLEREGKPLTIDFCAAPASATTHREH